MYLGNVPPNGFIPIAFLGKPWAPWAGAFPWRYRRRSSQDSGAWRSRSALLTTDTELILIASAAIIGDNMMPNHGYSTPAANGTPIAL